MSPAIVRYRRRDGGDHHHDVLAEPVDQLNGTPSTAEHVGAAEERRRDHGAGLEVGPQATGVPEEGRAEHSRWRVPEDWWKARVFAC